MGAEWPAGAALAMESWPTRSRGLMSGLLQGSWSIGFLLSSAAYGLLYDKIGWRGLLILGVLPALTVVWIRIYVKEPTVWVENRRIQREQRQEFRAPLLDIFRLRILGNTIMACLCWRVASSSTTPSTACSPRTCRRTCILARRWLPCRSRWPTWWRSWRAASGALSPMCWAADGR